LLIIVDVFGLGTGVLRQCWRRRYIGTFVLTWYVSFAMRMCK